MDHFSNGLLLRKGVLLQEFRILPIFFHVDLTLNVYVQHDLLFVRLHEHLIILEAALPCDFLEYLQFLVSIFLLVLGFLIILLLVLVVVLLDVLDRVDPFSTAPVVLTLHDEVEVLVDHLKLL